MPEDNKPPLFDDDDHAEDLVLAVDEVDDGDQDASPDPEALPWWQDRAQLQEFLNKWQLPLIFLFTVLLLSILWSLLGKSTRTTNIEFSVENRERRAVFRSKPFEHFNATRRDAAQVEQAIQDLPDPMGSVASHRLRRFLETHEPAAFEGDDVFLVNRVGDRYAQTVISRLHDDPEETDTEELRLADRWLQSNLSGPGTRRAEEQLLNDLIAVNEELGDRTGDRQHYARALEHLDRWNALDQTHPRHHRRARLHYKAGTQDDLRLAREFIEASRLSSDPQEISERHRVLTMLGKIYAHDGQIREAERQFLSLMNSATQDLERAETSQHLGEMREILAHRAHDDGRDPRPRFDEAEKAFEEAMRIYDEHATQSDEAIKKREIARFHIGSIKLYRGLLNRNETGDERELNEARDIFNRMRRFVDRSDKPMRYAINVRRTQANTALGRGEDAEDILEDIMSDHRERYWDRTRLVTPEEVVNVIHGLADVHEANQEFRRQVGVLEYLDVFLDKDDKDGRTRNAVEIARAWIRDGEARLGDEARVSFRKAAGTYLGLLAEPMIRFPKLDRLDMLWNAYLQYKTCFDPERLGLWKIALARKDKDSAISVLDRIIDTDPSPRTNLLLNQAIYLKGLLLEELFRIEDAIETYEDNIDTLELGGDNVYVFLSFLQRARARASLGGTDNIDQAIRDCEDLFALSQISPEAEPWRDARFLHGGLNLQLAMRLPDGSPKKIDYLRNGIRSLDEAIERYPDSPLRLRAHVDAGLAKIHMSQLEPLENIRYVEAAINDFETAERLAQAKTLTPEDRDLKKIAMMNLGLAHLELEGRHLVEAARAFDRLSRAFRRDRVEPWSLIQLHRTYRQLAEMARNTSRQNMTPELERQIQEYLAESERAAEKAIGSWNQIVKLNTQTFSRDFPLEYWRDSDTWLLNLEQMIDDMKNRLGES